MIFILIFAIFRLKMFFWGEKLNFSPKALQRLFVFWRKLVGTNHESSLDTIPGLVIHLGPGVTIQVPCGVSDYFPAVSSGLSPLPLNISMTQFVFDVFCNKKHTKNINYDGSQQNWRCNKQQNTRPFGQNMERRVAAVKQVKDDEELEHAASCDPCCC